MSKRGENIYKRKDGRWEGRYIKRYVQKDGKVKPYFGYVYARSYVRCVKSYCKRKRSKCLKSGKLYKESEQKLLLCRMTGKLLPIPKFYNLRPKASIPCGIFLWFFFYVKYYKSIRKCRKLFFSQEKRIGL